MFTFLLHLHFKDNCKLKNPEPGFRKRLKIDKDK